MHAPFSLGAVAGARRGGSRAVHGRAGLEAGQAAWLAAVPTAAITLLAIVLLGPPLGRLLPHPQLGFWAEVRSIVRPEPTEQARFLIALSAPLLLSALTVALVRRARPVSAHAAARLALGAELLAVAAVAGCFVAQRVQRGQSYDVPPKTVVYFTLPTLVVAAASATALIAAVRSAGVRARFARWTAESPARRGAAAALAVLAIAVALLPALNTDATVMRAAEPVWFHLQFTYDEAMAVLDGRSPLGDFAAQYASLWPYALAGGMALLGSSLAVFTALMATLAGVTLLALYDLLRRLARSSLAGLLLFAPLLALDGYRLHGASSVDRFSLVNYFGVMPLRYAGPFLLAWLTARHLDGARPRRAWPLFLAGGLAALNNADFGIAALGATVAALLWSCAQPSVRALRTLALEAAVGLGAALALVAALVLARTGETPHLSLLLSYTRVFAAGGYAMLAIKPLIGFSTVIFLTYVIAIGVATVRALRGEPDRLMTGMLAWSGVFGLGAGAYYVGHSLSEVLTYAFPSWGLAIALLTLVSVRALAARPSRRPRPSEAACLFAFGLMACALAQAPAPWSQLERLSRHGPREFAHPPGEAIVRQYARRGEQVLILTTLGHRLAVELGVDDVEPFTGSRSIQTRWQLDQSLAALREAGGRKLFVWPQETTVKLQARLQEAGWEQRVQEGGFGVTLWTPRRR